MRRIRVLIVDDAVVIRRLLGDVLAGDPAIEVVGAAPNGRIALAKIPQVNPDLITLDIEMPDMSGLETLAEIRRTYPTLPVIMFSTLTERGASSTLEALALGATDYVTKPANVGSVAAAMQAVREQLIPKIKAFCATAVGLPRPTTARIASPVASRMAMVTGRTRTAEALLIGVSTGGPNALSVLLPALPKDLPVPVLIVQHMPPVFTRLLAERLQAKSGFPVREAIAGARIEPGCAWVAPGDHHMTLERDALGVKIALGQGPPENSCRPAVDVLFRSAAAVYGAGTLAVVLTGMGQDGLRGCQDVHAAGGQIVVQDQATSVVWGMPGAVADAGLAEKILPLAELAGEIVRRLRAARAPDRAVVGEPQRTVGRP
ncbi:MAG TPA: chemotaxis response regulator protein-glutamate methylesterase [Candidatus Binatia bacterium]|jgi:two-component system chemotaxis response regulator CheB|nr:chemotaxis response regulator protein-glutamate methylesterase [Candidatus Binatia bacterium]